MVIIRRSKKSPLVCYNGLLVLRDCFLGSCICFLPIKYPVMSHTQIWGHQGGWSCSMKLRVFWGLWCTEKFPLVPAGELAWNDHRAPSLGCHIPAWHCSSPSTEGHEAEEAYDKTSLTMGSITRREVDVPQSLLDKCYSYSPSDMIGAYKSQQRLPQHVPLKSWKRKCSWIFFLFQF